MAYRLGKNRPVEELGPPDFAALRAKMAAKWGPVKLGVSVTKVRSVFNWAAENDVIPLPVKFGSDFVQIVDGASQPCASAIRPPNNATLSP